MGQRSAGERPKKRIDAQGRALLAQFLASCRAQGRSVQALNGLRDRVPKLLEYLGEICVDVAALGAHDAQAYTGWLSAQLTRSGAPYAATSVASYQYAARAFFAYLKSRGVVVANPFQETRRVRTPKRIPRGLLKEPEMARLLEHLCRFDQLPSLKTAVARYRVHVAAELMYSTGLRVSEVAALTLDDIDFSRSTVRVRSGKGGFERLALLNEFARETLRLFVDRGRAHVLSAANEPNAKLLFGTGWSWWGIFLNKELAKACAELGLPAMRSHGFRHAVGYHLLRAGCPIRYIQSVLGHKRLRTTEVYTRVEKQDLQRVVDACHPRKWKSAEHAIA